MKPTPVLSRLLFKKKSNPEDGTPKGYGGASVGPSFQLVGRRPRLPVGTGDVVPLWEKTKGGGGGGEINEKKRRNKRDGPSPITGDQMKPPLDQGCEKRPTSSQFLPETISEEDHFRGKRKRGQGGDNGPETTRRKGKGKASLLHLWGSETVMKGQGVSLRFIEEGEEQKKRRPWGYTSRRIK